MNVNLSKRRRIQAAVDRFRANCRPFFAGFRRYEAALLFISDFTWFIFLFSLFGAGVLVGTYSARQPENLESLSKLSQAELYQMIQAFMAFLSLLLGVELVIKTINYFSRDNKNVG